MNCDQTGIIQESKKCLNCEKPCIGKYWYCTTLCHREYMKKAQNALLENNHLRILLDRVNEENAYSRLNIENLTKEITDAKNYISYLENKIYYTQLEVDQNKRYDKKLESSKYKTKRTRARSVSSSSSSNSYNSYNYRKPDNYNNRKSERY